MAAPPMYPEQVSISQPDPYGGGQVNYANMGGPPASSSNMNAYPGMGGVVNPYGPTQGNANGYSTNYNYWTPENKWNTMNSAAPMPAGVGVAPNQNYVQPNITPPPPQNYGPSSLAGPTQSYMQPTGPAPPHEGYPQPNLSAPAPQSYGQPNPTGQWVGSYSTHGGYAQNETSVAHYAPDQSQQQQSAPFYGSAPTFQGVNQPLSYAPDGTATNYQNEAKSGDVSAYYSATGYTAQQTGYVSSYNQA